MVGKGVDGALLVTFYVWVLLFLMLLLDVLHVVLDLGHRLLHRLAVHVLLDHAMYLLLLLIAKDGTRWSVILALHPVVLYRNLHLLHRPPLSTCHLTCLPACIVFIKLIPQRKQHPLNSFGHHLHAVFRVLRWHLHIHLLEYFMIQRCPIIRLLLYWMGIWVIMEVHQLWDKVLHDFGNKDYGNWVRERENTYLRLRSHVRCSFWVWIGVFHPPSCRLLAFLLRLFGLLRAGLDDLIYDLPYF